MMRLTMIRDHIVIPALGACGIHSAARERLVMATGLAESHFEAVRQKGGGPALGYFQMESMTHDDIWARYLGASKRQALLDGLRALSDTPGEARELECNPFYAAAMCGIHYLRVAAPLPHPNDIEGMAGYWKRYYNTAAGKGTVQGFIAKAANAFRI